MFLSIWDLFGVSSGAGERAGGAAVDLNIGAERDGCALENLLSGIWVDVGELHVAAAPTALCRQGKSFWGLSDQRVTVQSHVCHFRGVGGYSLAFVRFENFGQVSIERFSPTSPMNPLETVWKLKSSS